MRATSPMSSALIYTLATLCRNQSFRVGPHEKSCPCAQQAHHFPDYGKRVLCLRLQSNAPRPARAVDVGMAVLVPAGTTCMDAKDHN
jgi:hypothetical protein